jgi:hypothetical protein
LARGYKAQLLNAVIGLLMGAPEQSQNMFLQGWVDWQLTQLGLRLPVQLENDRTRLAQQALPLTRAEAYWNGDEADPIFMMALFDFMVSDLAVSPQQITSSLADGRIRLYSDWLLEMVDGRYTLPELEERWQQYLVNLAD